MFWSLPLFLYLTSGFDFEGGGYYTPTALLYWQTSLSVVFFFFRFSFEKPWPLVLLASAPHYSFPYSAENANDDLFLPLVDATARIYSAGFYAPNSQRAQSKIPQKGLFFSEIRAEGLLERRTQPTVECEWFFFSLLDFVSFVVEMSFRIRSAQCSEPPEWSTFVMDDFYAKSGGVLHLCLSLSFTCNLILRADRFF